MRQKLISLFTLLAMILPSIALSSTVVYAQPPEFTCLIVESTVEYATLDAALMSVTNGQTIKLLNDIIHTNTIEANNEVLSIDLNGFNLTVKDVPGNALYATNNGTLNISDPDDDGLLMVTSAGPEKSAAYATDGGVINIEGDLHAVYPGGLNNQNIFGALATGTGSQINIVGNSTGYTAGVYAINSATITVSGNVTGSYYGGFSAYNGLIDITGDLSGSYALTVEYGGLADVVGNITGGTAVYVRNSIGHNAPAATITGNVISTGDSALSISNSSDILINGNVNGNIYLAEADVETPSLTINGNVTVTHGPGASVNYGGMVIINGSIIGASPFLQLDNKDISEDDYVLSSDYRVYSKSTYDEYTPVYLANTVKVMQIEPSAEQVSITGTPSVGAELSGIYEYSSPANIEEGDTTFRWLRVSSTPSLLGEDYLLYSTNNTGGVTSSPGGPTTPASFIVTDPTYIEKISNYHYATSDTPGTISLHESGGAVYGPWDAVLEGYWRVYPKITIPAGTYTIIDSKPDSWSYNSESGYAGMTEVVGYTEISGAVEQGYTLQRNDANKSIIFEATPVDINGHIGLPEMSDPFGSVAYLSSNNADLKALSISPVALSPVFNSSVMEYTATVPHSTTFVTVDTSASDALAKIFINSVESKKNNIELNIGINLISILVAAEDGLTTKTYTLSITREAAPEDPVDPVDPVDRDRDHNDDKPATPVVVTATIGKSTWNTVTVAPKIEDVVDTVLITTAMTEALLEKAADTEGTDAPDVLNVAVTSGTATEPSELEVSLFQSNLKKIVDQSDASLQITAPWIAMTFDAKALETIHAANDGGEITFSAGTIDPDLLNAADQARVEGRPVYDLTVKNGSEVVSEFGGGYATVRIQYELKDGESPESIVIFVLMDDSSLEAVRGYYEAAEGMVVFKTPHFSKFVISHNPVAFRDVAAGAWYREAVSFIAARGITSGIADGLFAPQESLTRAQFVVMLLKAYGIEAEDAAEAGASTLIVNFTDAGNTYYTNALYTAKALGIAKGIGSNLFAPDRSISREEMLVLLHNALTVMNEMPAVDDSSARPALESFADAVLVSEWAKPGISEMIRNGVISGADNRIMPKDMTTRAEMAQVLYQLLGR
ncbi:MAG: hypothetical protein GT601_15215 [Acidaminobacter sp.]|uniref:S-layer homology domain-containing protein n=1 Tax=Acidaminobacter sp. TaxID=1872102 RepID=UPI001381C0F9|nr:S-layer homology domain-containing protein [Acidaminobacter sp.]MZQ99016.1 hypothetical protein [Acidaminobacter sp.]